MRRNIILALSIVLTIFSCGTEYFDEKQTVNNEVSNSKTKTISFAVGSNDMALTKADTKTTLADFVSYLQYWIFDEGYNNVKVSGTQKTSDSNFGTFSAELAYDSTYHVVVVAHNNENVMTLGDGNLINLSSSDKGNSETYYGNTKCSVTRDGTTSTSISISKNVCFLCVTSKGTHSNVGALKVKLNAFGTGFYANTGHTGTDNITYNRTYTLTDKNKTSDSIRVKVYFPMPSDEENSNVSASFTLYALDESTVLKTVNISGIPAKVGRKVFYTGSFLQSAQGFTVALPEDSWEKKDMTY